MFATQTRRGFQPRHFKRLKINLPYIFRGLGELRFYDNGSDTFLGQVLQQCLFQLLDKTSFIVPYTKKAISLLAHKPTTTPIRGCRFPPMRIFPRRLRACTRYACVVIPVSSLYIRFSFGTSLLSCKCALSFSAFYSLQNVLFLFVSYRVFLTAPNTEEESQPKTSRFLFCLFPRPRSLSFYRRENALKRAGQV